MLSIPKKNYSDCATLIYVYITIHEWKDYCITYNDYNFKVDTFEYSGCGDIIITNNYDHNIV